MAASIASDPSGRCYRLDTTLAVVHFLKPLTTVVDLPSSCEGLAVVVGTCLALGDVVARAEWGFYYDGVLGYYTFD